MTFLAGEHRKFTCKELEEYNGKNGKPAYIAYQGKVYGISQSDLWRGGEHMGMHLAGKDLTEEVELSLPINSRKKDIEHAWTMLFLYLFFSS